MAKKNLDGMRYPSIDALVGKTDEFTLASGEKIAKKLTKYQVAYLAAKRAHEIEEDERDKEALLNKCKDDETVMIEIDQIEKDDDYLCVKPVGKALEEYLNGEVHCLFKSNDLGDKK
jgi:DNA-directed RNA polymerase subunit K/omega